MAAGSQLFTTAIISYVNTVMTLAQSSYNNTMSEAHSKDGVDADKLLTRGILMAEATTLGFWGAIIASAGYPKPLLDLKMDDEENTASDVVPVIGLGNSAPVPTDLYLLGGTGVIKVSDNGSTYITAEFSSASRNELKYKIEYLQKQISPIPAGIYQGAVLLDNEILATVSLRVTKTTP